MCEYSTKMKKNIQKHKETQHSLEPRKEYSCTQCPKVYLNIRNLKAHIASNKHEQRQLKWDKKKDYICPECGKPFLGYKLFKIHIKEAHKTQLRPKKKYSCTNCVKIYSSSNNLKTHLARNSCPQCGKNFCSYKLLKIHIEDLHKTGFKCEPCNYVTSRKRKFNEHKQTHKARKHNQRKRDYSCPQCGKHFRGYKLLKIHIKDVHKTGFKCDTCNYVTSRKRKFNEHKQIHKSNLPMEDAKSIDETEHINDEAEVFPCHICDWVTEAHEELRDHLFKHKDEIQQKKLILTSTSKMSTYPQPQVEEDNYTFQDGMIWYKDPLFGKIPVVAKNMPKPSSEVINEKLKQNEERIF